MARACRHPHHRGLSAYGSLRKARGGRGGHCVLTALGVAISHATRCSRPIENQCSGFRACSPRPCCCPQCRPLAGPRQRRSTSPIFPALICAVPMMAGMACGARAGSTINSGSSRSHRTRRSLYPGFAVRRLVRVARACGEAIAARSRRPISGPPVPGVARSTQGISYSDIACA